jgi:N-acetylglucosaminyldiphosphoundecaprenol N-acetyl-beta-D-mannosaminyltransferase
VEIITEQEIQRCEILGVNVCVTNMQETLDIIIKNLNNLKGKYICVSNVHTIVMSYDDETYRNVQNSGYMVLPDGKPLSLVSRLNGFKKAERVTGPDFMEHIFNISEEKHFRHFFYGSTDQTLKSLQNELYAKYPYLNIAGMYSPPFRELTPEEDRQIIEIINKSSPDFVWVGLGAPKQERWMYNHMDKIEGLMVGVGAGFDYFSKNISRAPLWMQEYSLEWFYRLIQDFKRLWKRYLMYNTRFVALVVREYLT